MEVPAQCFVLHRVPANPYTQAQLATAQHIHFRGLLGDKHRLPLRQDDDPGDQFQLRQRRQVAKEHERLVELVLGRIALPTGTMGGVRSQDMVIHDEVAVAQAFSGLRIVADPHWIRADLVLGENDS